MAFVSTTDHHSAGLVQRSARAGSRGERQQRRRSVWDDIAGSIEVRSLGRNSTAPRLAWRAWAPREAVCVWRARGGRARKGWGVDLVVHVEAEGDALVQLHLRLRCRIHVQ
eukprot:1623164-Rhodomonas_salina.1